MGNKRSKKVSLILLSVLVAFLLQQLSLVPCVAPTTSDLDHHVVIAATEPKAADDDQYTRRSTCNGTIGECNTEDDEEEMMMESEISRRFLAQGSGQIGYDAISHGGAICGNKGGTSYGNCHASPSNGDSRGCEGQFYCRSRLPK